MITSKTPTPKNIRCRHSIQIEAQVLRHVQEEIPAPNGK